MTHRRNPAPAPEEVVEYVHERICEVGFAPSRREVAAEFGVSATTAQNVITQAMADGLLETSGLPGNHRSLRLTDAGRDAIGVGA